MKESAFENFMKRLPTGADIMASGKEFDYEGQILFRDETHIIIGDGESIQLVRIDVINDLNYVLPDAPLEIMVPEEKK